MRGRRKWESIPHVTATTAKLKEATWSYLTVIGSDLGLKNGSFDHSVIHGRKKSQLPTHFSKHQMKHCKTFRMQTWFHRALTGRHKRHCTSTSVDVCPSQPWASGPGFGSSGPLLVSRNISTNTCMHGLNDQSQSKYISICQYTDTFRQIPHDFVSFHLWVLPSSIANGRKIKQNRRPDELNDLRRCGSTTQHTEFVGCQRKLRRWWNRHPNKWKIFRDSRPPTEKNPEASKWLKHVKTLQIVIKDGLTGFHHL